MSKRETIQTDARHVEPGYTYTVWSFGPSVLEDDYMIDQVKVFRDVHKVDSKDFEGRVIEAGERWSGMAYCDQSDKRDLEPEEIAAIRARFTLAD